MRANAAIIIALLCWVMSGCAKNTNMVSSDNHSIRMHAQPMFSIFPDTSIHKYSIDIPNKNSHAYDSAMALLMQKYALSGISATVISPDDGIWSKDTGAARRLNDSSDSSPPIFYWASVSKLITSVIVHQLIIEGKVSINDTLKKWFPSLENSQFITIHELLNHTSGIYNFGSDSSFHYSNKYYSPEALLDIVKMHKSDFYPGTGWNYTNTGYLILALICEKVENLTFSELVSRRIAKPYALSTLKSLTANELPLNLVTQRTIDANIQNSYSTPVGAGNVVGSSKDLAHFVSKLMMGGYIPQRTIHGMMQELYGMFDAGMYYGDGIMLYDFSEINKSQNTWIGHSGGIENYKAVAIYDVSTGLVCAVSVSQNFSAESVARLLISLTAK